MSDGLSDQHRLREEPSYFVEQVIGLDVFSYQKEFLDTDDRHFVIASGRQVGKSRMCAWRALQHAVTHAGAQVLITAPSLRQSSLLFDTLYSEIDNSGLSDADWGIERDTQTIIEFDNGSAIHCLPTGRNGDKIRGFSADLVIVDEAAFIDDSIFEDILQPMLLATGGSMILASTPWGTSSFFYRKFNNAQYDDNQWGRLRVHSRENPLIEDDDIEELKEGKTEAQIDREIRGQFTEDSAQFFPEDAIVSCFGTATGTPAADVPTYLGADIAAAGDDQTVMYALDDTGNVFHTEVHGSMGVLEAADRIEVLDSSFGFSEIVIDRTGLGQGTLEKLTDSGQIDRKLRPEYFSIQTKTKLYQGLKTALQRQLLALPDNSTMHKQLADISASKTSAGNLKFDTRQREHDDHVDALALAVSALETDTGRQAGAPGGTQATTASSGRARGADSRRDTTGPSRDHDTGRSWSRRN